LPAIRGRASIPPTTIGGDEQAELVDLLRRGKAPARVGPPSRRRLVKSRLPSSRRPP
jgi:hypothetical protein